jgi:hypothetical protein
MVDDFSAGAAGQWGDDLIMNQVVDFSNLTASSPRLTDSPVHGLFVFTRSAPPFNELSGVPVHKTTYLFGANSQNFSRRWYVIDLFALLM